MKTLSRFITSAVAVSAITAGLVTSCSTNLVSTYNEEIVGFQQELNASYLDSATSPLRGKNFSQFSQHPFFPANRAYRVEAKLIRMQNPAIIDFPTSSGVSKKYREFATAHFRLNGQSVAVKLYQSLALLDDPAYQDYLFLPFRDATNGVETYGGGRYIELKIPASNKILIDFNKAYQPYCAYNAYDYSCPIVPEENVLPLRIEAGVRYDDVYFE